MQKQPNQGDFGQQFMKNYMANQQATQNGSADGLAGMGGALQQTAMQQIPSAASACCGG